jgi:pimeloyl-ACP methyl ester carboxylesterase
MQERQGQQQGLAGRAYAPDLREERPHMAFLYDSIMALNPPRPQPSGERDARHTATSEKLAALQVPVQFVVGQKDAIVSPEIIGYAASLIPGARFAEVAGSGHSVYFEKPEEFNEIVSAFFETVERAGAK